MDVSQFTPGTHCSFTFCSISFFFVFCFLLQIYIPSKSSISSITCIICFMDLDFWERLSYAWLKTFEYLCRHTLSKIKKRKKAFSDKFELGQNKNQGIIYKPMSFLQDHFWPGKVSFPAVQIVELIMYQSKKKEKKNPQQFHVCLLASMAGWNTSWINFMHSNISVTISKRGWTCADDHFWLFRRSC